MNNKLNYSVFFCILLIKLFILLPLSAQNPEKKVESADYMSMYNKGTYNDALKVIKDRLQAIYITRAEDKKIPTEYIYIKKGEEKKNINDLFRNRKAKQYFIEENNELYTLHLFAARCCFKLDKEDASLNHYFESLRYKSSVFYKDDFVFYEISQVYKKLNQHNAYTDSLEMAYSINPAKTDYSLELGKALSITNQKKKAIFHLKRYTESKAGDIEDPTLFLLIGNLNEDIGEYLETVKYYKKYLEKKTEDGYIIFALGYLAYKRVGDHKLALDNFNKSLKYLPDKDLFRRSKAAEFQADIYMKDLEYERAIEYYIETKKYHDKIKDDLDDNNKKISKMNSDINEIKTSLHTQKLYDRYSAYQDTKEEKGKLEFRNREIKYELGKLNSGRIRWNLAESFERLEKYDQAIQYYNEAVSNDYNADKARERIVKLKLKIKRGY